MTEFDLGDLNKLPLELTEHIFLHLDAYSLAKTRRVCKACSDLIDNSKTLSYQRKLAQSGLVQNGVAFPTVAAERLACLDKYINSSLFQLKNGPEVIDDETPMMGMNLWEFFGNVLAQQSGEGITFKRFRSSLTGTPERMWTAKPNIHRVRDFGMEPSQDLLVLIQAPIWRGPHANRAHLIHLRTMETGEVHPAAKEKTLHLEAVIPDAHMTHGIQVCGEYLHIFFKSEAQESYIIVWNWKTGTKIMHLTGLDISSSVFLSDTHLVICLGDITHMSLALVNFHIQGTEKTRLESAVMDSVLELPDMRVLFIAHIRCDPTPAWPVADPLVPFHDDPDQLLYTVTMWTEGGHHFTIIIPRTTLLAQVSTQEDGLEPVLRTWEEWGEQGTRILDADHHSPPSPVWSCTTFGSSMVAINEDKTVINMFDFSRLRVLQEISEDAPQINPQEPFDFPCEEEDRTAVCIEPTLLLGGEGTPFTSTVKSALPFRARAIKIDLGDATSVVAMRGWDNVVLVNSHARTFRVLSF
ncbi:hypothetical protein CYLTODRAFT_425829 [Cylindrobasidium torrendii FP15055 ss-10]|uniref:F-box domain-containing protein n=1 Tax=Cylindrobasidium torrendii FP15055 ss-10 TaxID=1314674 RepID=A0A0D7AZX3_9AGAR|nr:hypothetical protein CYLTODRAFT_425829 [Cylindrobasidium torrendii FP15055 ss-10]